MGCLNAQPMGNGIIESAEKIAKNCFLLSRGNYQLPFFGSCGAQIGKKCILWLYWILGWAHTDGCKTLKLAKWEIAVICSVLSQCWPNLAWSWTYPRGLRTHHEIQLRPQYGLARGWKPQKSSLIKVALLRLHGGCGLISLHGQLPRG